MAIQNFLSGGYYGKLGQTVGQRWKNKRTIRAYVIPANPRTAKQQANRGQFGNAVLYSQMGMQMNYLTTLFDRPDMSQWNARMSTARDLRKSGATNLDLIPLYPMSFTPPYLITELNIKEVSGVGLVTFYVSGTLPSVDRRLSCMLDIKTTTGAEVGLKLYLADFHAGAQPTITMQLDDPSEINTQCLARLVSLDDTDSSTDFVVSAQLPITHYTPIVDNWLVDDHINNYMSFFKNQDTGNFEYLVMSLRFKGGTVLAEALENNDILLIVGARVAIYQSGTLVQTIGFNPTYPLQLEKATTLASGDVEAESDHFSNMSFLPQDIGGVLQVQLMPAADETSIHIRNVTTHEDYYVAETELLDFDYEIQDA